jgi:hypothetical protein
MHITPDQAEEALRAHAFHDEEADRHVVHCFAGTIGADWDLEGAVKLVRQPDARCSYEFSIFGRCLVVRTDEFTRTFDTVPYPPNDGCLSCKAGIRCQFHTLP